MDLSLNFTHLYLGVCFHLYKTDMEMLELYFFKIRPMHTKSIHKQHSMFYDKSS